MEDVLEIAFWGFYPGPIQAEFGVCYECRDGFHNLCVGACCECNCGHADEELHGPDGEDRLEDEDA